MLAIRIRLTEEQFKNLLGFPEQTEIIEITTPEAPWSSDIEISIKGIGYKTPEGTEPPAFFLGDHICKPSSLYRDLLKFDSSLRSNHSPDSFETYYPFQNLLTDFPELAEHLVKTIENNQHLNRASLVGLVEAHLRENLT